MSVFVEKSDERNRLVAEKLLLGGAILVSKPSQAEVLIYSPAKKWTVDMVDDIPSESVVFAGNIPIDIMSRLINKAVVIYDMMKDEKFVNANARLTAEGVLALLLSNCPKSIYDTRVLILGSGRVATAIIILLGKLGVGVSICEFDNNRQGMYSLSKDVIESKLLGEKIGEYDIIVNTVPAPILTKKLVAKISRHTVLIEVASVSCLVEGVELNYLKASGLPQKYCPLTASKLIVDFVRGKIQL